MTRLSLPTALLATAACLALAACAVPLGPGYEIEKQEVLLTYSPEAPQTVRVRAAYRLKNAGNADLSELDLRLPAQLASQHANEPIRARVLVEGREAAVRPKEAPSANGGAAGGAVATVSFASPWPQKKKLALVVEYDLALPAQLDAFYFDAGDWFPELVVPDALLAKGRERADKVDLRLRVPQGWRAISSGRERGSRRVRPRGGDALREFRFEVKRLDFAPYVVAGQYHEQRFTSAGRTLVFWTLTPQASFQSDATNYFQALAALENFFGPRRDPRHPTWIVEEGYPRQVGIGPFPHGVLQPEGKVTPQAAVPSGGDGDMTPLRNRMLFARLWTAHDASPGDSDSLLENGLALYASMVTEPSMAAQRTAFIGESCTEQAQDPRKERDPVFFQALFLHALEDRIGKENVQHGVRRMIQGMQGSTYGWNEIRSALEAESGQDLAEMFRTWLGDGGIPEEFCKKYVKGSDQ